MDGTRPSEDRPASCAHCGAAHPDDYDHCPRTGQALLEGDALLGRVIADRYRIVERLGTGGMGTVYAAENLRIGRRVALKRLHPTLRTSAEAIARFEREARAAAATGHENVIDVLDLGTDEAGAPYLVMELLEGETLSSMLARERRLAPKKACELVGQILAALDAVHRVGIMHRDLKPENVFITRRGKRSVVKVLDFGVSKFEADESALRLTRTGIVIGTPFYMSPEQARGSQEFDQRADVYACGVMLYEAIAGALPFQGDNYHALLHAIVAAKPTPLLEHAPGLPGLADVVHKAIAAEPAGRFQSAAEMIAALTEFGAEPLERSPSAPPRARPRAGLAETMYSDGEPDRGAPEPPPSPRPSVAPARASATRSKRRSLHDYAPLKSDGMRASSASRHAPPTPPPDASPFRESPTSKTRTVVSEAPRGDGTSRVKGTFFAVAMQMLEATHGPAGVELACSALTAEERAQLDPHVLTVSWLPLSLFERFLEGADRVVETPAGTFARSVGAAVADRDLAGAYRVFVEGASAGRAARRLPALFRAYHDAGEPHLVATSEGACDLEILSAARRAPFHDLVVVGFAVRFLEIAGAKDVEGTTRSYDSSVMVTLRWRAA